MNTQTDEERMRAVDAVRIRSVQPDRDKRTESGRKRFLRTAGNHNVLLAACRCPYAAMVGKPGGVCCNCAGAVLTGEERAQ